MRVAKDVRLQDVALRAGVSSATASKALNDRSGVSAATKARVLAAMEELGYEPVSGEAAPYPQMALVADDLTTTYTLDILRGSAMAAQEAGIGLVTQYTATHHGALPPLSDDWFDAGALDSLTSQEWVISNESNRIGLRLEGRAVERCARSRTPSRWPGMSTRSIRPGSSAACRR